MSQPNIVIDTNVLISALRSDGGSAYRLLLLIGEGPFDISISIPLALEYEEVCKRLSSEISWTTEDIDDVLDYLCRVARRTRIHFKWPLLPDADDEMLLELAVAAQCNFIVTFNTANFRTADQFGIRVCTPFEFLEFLQENP
jgi:putative PIN family toxin of toxin-antitoxin system